MFPELPTATITDPFPARPLMAWLASELWLVQVTPLVLPGTTVVVVIKPNVPTVVRRRPFCTTPYKPNPTPSLREDQLKPSVETATFLFVPETGATPTKSEPSP